MTITTTGIDIGKTVIHVVGLNALGCSRLRRKNKAQSPVQAELKQIERT